MIMIITSILSWIHLSVVTIRHQRTGELIWSFRPNNGVFSIQWMHSVELEQWRETFQITDDGNIKLIESRFRAWGAGVPEHEGKVFYRDQEWFVMKEFENRTFEQLTISVSCYANHRIIDHSKKYKMCDWVEDNTSVVIQNEEQSVLAYFYHLIFKEVSIWKK